ncbi:MAG: ribonuclease E activity regulator RraA [Gammaproteobacteria bacterium]|nr:ribonuclease E activity regulator RraA [Gammaproteobacteria bacterium]
MTTFKTADLYDSYGDLLQVAEPIFRQFGRRTAFAGPIVAVKVFEDNTLVRASLETPGRGAVLVVDGGGSTRCALVGDLLARLAIDNGWAGIIVNGCIRDSAEIDGMDIGIRALATNPARSEKRGEGRGDVKVGFAGVSFTPGHHVYADADGVVVSEKDLADGTETVLV